MPLKLYYFITSTPSRSVLHTLNALNAPYEPKSINLRQRDQFSEEYLKINPQHTVPTIDEDGFVLCESNAINAYLVKKFGKIDEFYPKEYRARARVDQILHFHNGFLFGSLKQIFRKIVKERAVNKITDELRIPVEEAYDSLEKYLADGRKFAARDNITIADFSIIPTLNALSFFVPVNKEKYSLITDYVKRVYEKNMPGFKKLEDEALQKFEEILKSVNYEFI